MTDHARAAQSIEYVLRRLSAAYPLSPGAQLALSQAVTVRPIVPDHVEIDVNGCAAFLLRGLACRSRSLPDGRRQYTAFLVSGDTCDYGFLSGCVPTARILSLTRCMIAEVRMPRFVELCDRHPDVLRALMRNAAVETANAEEHIISLGLRSAAERLGHLFCELHYRFAAVGLVNGGGFDFQVTQAEIGEGLGMSAVHVNRTLQRLRRDKFVSTSTGRINITDRAGLRDMAGYSPVCLQ